MSTREASCDRDLRLGEVVEATTTEFVVQCYELYTAPPLGSLVRCGDDEAIYGIVHEIATRSIDTGRRPIARGQDEDDEVAIYQSNPQLSRLLSTEFRALSVGHTESGRLRRWLAPLPPRIHSFVYPCSDDAVREFSAELDFASILLSAPIRSGRRAGGISEDGGPRAPRPRRVPGERRQATHSASGRPDAAAGRHSSEDSDMTMGANGSVETETFRLGRIPETGHGGVGLADRGDGGAAGRGHFDRRHQGGHVREHSGAAYEVLRSGNGRCARLDGPGVAIIPAGRVEPVHRARGVRDGGIRDDHGGADADAGRGRVGRRDWTVRSRRRRYRHTSPRSGRPRTRTYASCSAARTTGTSG